MTRKNCRSHCRPAMTLLELLLALGLITLLSATMFIFYDVCLRSREAGTIRMDQGQLARVVADRIAEEIRSSNGFLIQAGPGVTGDERMITLQTVRLPDAETFHRRTIKDAPLPGQCDIRQVQYYLAYDPEQSFDYPDGTIGPAPLGLVRREVRTPFQTARLDAQPEIADVDLYAREIKYLRFRFFDGVEWVDRWDMGQSAKSGSTDMASGSFGGLGNSLPQAVEVTVGYDALPPKEEKEKKEGFASEFLPAPAEPFSRDKVTVLVRLPQADVFFGSRMMRAQMASARAATGAEPAP